jgi:tripartite-type tricarboxylate transporter receptor subunit TctC
MRRPRRIAATILVLAAAAALGLGDARAAGDYPNRPVKLIVPFPAGGPTDVTARVVAAEMSKTLGQQIVIDNRAGAGGNVAADLAAKSPPDGYTVFFATGGTHGINPSLYKSIPYDPVKDFAPVVFVSTSANVFLATPASKVSTMTDLIAAAKAAPGKLNFATAGNGTTTHLSAELLRSLTGIEMVHVPYKGGAQAMTDLVAGQIEFMVDGLPSALPQIRAGAVKALGVTTARRLATAPEIPTVAETVPGFEAIAWYGLVVPAKTPQEAVDRLNAEANRALASEEVRRRYAELGSDPRGGTPEEFDRHVKSELRKWAEVVKATGAQVE